ncbi:tetratricopeptide repeat protein [Candidatus Parcubacteria bacterium]|nr:tetratricopeptide repeat protein [Candidatus Parcubacteria bacterium]
MSKKYQIFFLIVLILLIAVAGFFLYQRHQPASEENEIFSLPEGVILTENQQIKFDDAKNSLKANPNDHLALIAIAQVKYQVQDLDGAEKVYLMALEIQPTNTLILNNLGDIYNQQKEYENAEKMYLKIIEVNPNWRNAYRELKTLYRFHLKEKYPQIEGFLLKAIEDNKKVFGEAPVDFYSMLAVYYKDTSQKEKAIPYYEKVLELDPNNEGAKIDLEELKKLK